MKTLRDYGGRLLAKRDISRRALWVLALCLVLLKLVLAGRQGVYIDPDGAPIDDTLLYNAAVSITQGQWLGDYNWLTLSKYMLFPVWLAGLHTLGVPYLLGGQLLYTAACAVAAAAFAPVLRRNLTRLGLFAFLLYSPAAWAAAVQLRVYRDNLTPALALLLFGGFAGAALRRGKGVRAQLGFLLAGGLGLAGSYLNREDGAWLLVFAVAATAVTCLFLLFEPQTPHRVGRCLLQLVPYAMLGAGVLAFSALNYAHYGRFLVSDFTSREFKDACGALMRVSAAQPVERVPVSYAARQQIYAQVPEFAALEPILEHPDYMNGYADVQTHEYGAGAFYWALRRAVWTQGYADSAQEAQQYYENLAQAVNALCDAGKLPAQPESRHISGTLMPMTARAVGQSLGLAAQYFGNMLVFEEAEPAFEMISVATPEVAQEYSAFLREPVNLSAQPYTTQAYYTPNEMRAYALLRAVRVLYAVATPLLCAGALAWLVWGAVCLCGALRHKQAWGGLLVWLLALGLLLTAFLRCCIVGYMFATAFNPWVGKLLYLSGGYPALLLFVFLGSVQLGKAVRARRAARLSRAQPAGKAAG